MDPLVVLCFSLLQMLAFDSVASQFYSEDFVFPLEKSDDLSACTFGNGIMGRCVSLSECPHARDDYQSAGVNPTLCHFDKDEPFVCCNFNKSSEQLVDRRKSAAQCDEVNAMPVIPVTTNTDFLGEFHISVVGGEKTVEEEFPHMVR